MDYREELLNKLLSSAWDTYSAALESGEKIELESEMQDWVSAALKRNIRMPLEAP